MLRRHLELITGLAVVAVVLVLSELHGLRGIDLASIDARFAIRGTEKPRNVVLVGIDPRTFNQLENVRFPLPRKLDATVIRNLSRAGASAIAVDLEFNHPTDAADDNALIRTVRATPRVAISTVYVGPHGTTPIFGGGKALAYSRATPGDAQFPLDADGAIRRMTPQILGLPTLPLAVAQLASGHRIDFPGGSGGSVPIDFAGPDGTVPEISFADALHGRFPADAVRGKVVVIGQTGASDQGQQDIHTTATDSAMSGPEVEANAIETTLSGFPLRPAPGWLNVVLVALFALAAPALGRRLRPALATVVMAAAIVGLAVICQLAFDSGTIVGFVYPVTAAVLSIAAAFALQQRRLRAFEARLRQPADYFVCYRRGQSELAANLIKQTLERKVGEQRVFMDVHGIDSGEAWPQRLEEAIGSCSAILVLIGPDWVDARRADGSRRLDDPSDWVRREIETAFANPGITVVPILHDGAEVPEQTQLPESIRRLTDCQTARLTGIDMDAWIDTLTESVQSGRLRSMHRQAAEEPAAT